MSTVICPTPALTLANASVVLTMTQLEAVDGVVILSAGEPVLSNSTVPLTAEDFDLSGKSADPVTVKIPLYFLSENASDVIPESREIQASTSSVSAEVQAVLDALCAGPKTKGLRSFLPATSDGLSPKLKNKTCTLTIDDEWRNALLNSDNKATLSAWRSPPPSAAWRALTRSFISRMTLRSPACLTKKSPPSMIRHKKTIPVPQNRDRFFISWTQERLEKPEKGFVDLFKPVKQIAVRRIGTASALLLFFCQILGVLCHGPIRV